jgi:hypothetical protein
MGNQSGLGGEQILGRGPTHFTLARLQFDGAAGGTPGSPFNLRNRVKSLVCGLSRGTANVPKPRARPADSPLKKFW